MATAAPTLALVNNYLGPPTHQNGRWHYWFIEAFVQLTIAATVLVAIPVVRRLERRVPYLFALVVVGVVLTWRFHLLEIEGIVNLRFRTHGVAWLFALGWLVHQSRQRWQQVLTSAICLLTIPGSFGRPEHEWFIAAGLLVLLWCKDLPVPRALRVPISAVAAASIWIFISHFRVFPPLSRDLPLGVAYALTIAAGVALAGLVAVAGRQMPRAGAAAAFRRPRSCGRRRGCGVRGGRARPWANTVVSRSRPARVSRATSSRWVTLVGLLVDDRALVEVVGGVVGGRPDQLDAALVGLAVRVGADERRAGTSGGC